MYYNQFIGLRRYVDIDHRHIYIPKLRTEYFDIEASLDYVSERKSKINDFNSHQIAKKSFTDFWIR